MVSEDPIFNKLKNSLSKARTTASIKRGIDDSIDRVLGMIQVLTKNEIMPVKVSNPEEFSFERVAYGINGDTVVKLYHGDNNNIFAFAYTKNTENGYPVLIETKSDAISCQDESSLIEITSDILSSPDISNWIINSVTEDQAENHREIDTKDIPF
uniref:Uncharacterized protein n=1 Tax=Edwardsiella tarda TaxID=636 RepID=A0A2H5CQ83_EDWTA|nr:hypothetical protein [Edwardsiella tarda]AUH26715.1 hypothetical protein [Edwardsiella tarda]